MGLCPSLSKPDPSLPLPDMNLLASDLSLSTHSPRLPVPVLSLLETDPILLAQDQSLIPHDIQLCQSIMLVTQWLWCSSGSAHSA